MMSPVTQKKKKTIMHQYCKARVSNRKSLALIASHILHIATFYYQLPPRISITTTHRRDRFLRRDINACSLSSLASILNSLVSHQDPHSRIRTASKSIASLHTNIHCYHRNIVLPPPHLARHRPSSVTSRNAKSYLKREALALET